jgi:uncharacterized membrane protein (DUF2068 family)
LIPIEVANLRAHNKGLLVIAMFKWVNAALLCAVALGLLKLLHRDVSEVAENALLSLRVDPDNRFLGSVLAKLSLVDDPKLQLASAISFAYSALFAVEGAGLYLERRWAEYLTIIATASLLPLEVYQLIQKPDLLKVTLLVINLLIVGFLVMIVAKTSGKKTRRT